MKKLLLLAATLLIASLANAKVVEKTFTVRFYNGSTLLATYTDVAYGSDIDYDVVPVYNGPGNAGDYLFIVWYPLPENITSDTD